MVDLETHISPERKRILVLLQRKPSLSQIPRTDIVIILGRAAVIHENHYRIKEAK